MRSLLFGVAVLTTGCGSGSKIADAPPVEYDPAGIAQAALAALDKNKNGQIEGAELDACPALKAALPAIDQNNDKALSAAEIQKRVERYAAIGPVPISCTVTLDNQPLADATVTFEPESFMGSGLKTATAKTDKDGNTGTFDVGGQAFATLPPGLYRVRVTKDGATIPARYNTQSTLGREVMSDPRSGDATIELALRSR